MNGTSIRNIKRNIAEARGYPRSSLSHGAWAVIGDDYLKHRVNAEALQRWINMGMPDEPFIRPMNNSQRRAATRAVRAVEHRHRCHIADRFTTGKSAFRKKYRRAQ